MVSAALICNCFFDAFGRLHFRLSFISLRLIARYAPVAVNVGDTCSQETTMIQDSGITMPSHLL
jgi:hypothetical protein